LANSPKIDEQISYNWLFFLLAGAFGAVTLWAVWDESITRREYKTYQEAFFNVETSLAQKAFDDAKATLTGTRCADAAFRGKNTAACEMHDKWAAASTELKQREDDLAKKAAEYKAAKDKLQEADFTAFDKQQAYTFTKSNLDEAYYYFTLAKHHMTPST